MSEEVRKREYGKDRKINYTIRLTEAEKNRLQELADEAGLELAEYMRSTFKRGFVHIKDETGHVVKERK